MEKQLTPIQELIEWTDNSLVCQKELMNKVTRGVDATHINAEICVFTSLKIKLEGLLTKEKQSFIDFGNKLLDDQVGENGCGCGKDGGGDKPEELFNETFKTN